MESGRARSDDRAVRLGAGIAYYSLFALIPALAAAVSLASLFFSRDRVSEEMFEPSRSSSTRMSRTGSLQG